MSSTLEQLEEKVKEWNNEGIVIDVIYEPQLGKTTATVQYQGNEIYIYEDDEADEASQKEHVLHVILDKLQVSGVYAYTLVNGETYYVLEENAYEALTHLIYGKRPCLHPSKIKGIDLKFVPIDGVPSK